MGGGATASVDARTRTAGARRLGPAARNGPAAPQLGGRREAGKSERGGTPGADKLTDAPAPDLAGIRCGGSAPVGALRSFGDRRNNKRAACRSAAPERITPLYQ